MNKINKDSCKSSVFCAQRLILTPQSSKLLILNKIFNQSELLTNETAENVTEINIDYEYDLVNYFEVLCNCIKQSYDCTLFKGIYERNLVYNEILKNTFLALYILIMIAAIIVNLILVVLMITTTQQNNFCVNFIRKLTKQISTAKKGRRLALYNLDNNILLISLLTSYILTVVYVLPRQLVLFYTGYITHGADCKFTEFIKAFTVSLTIFSLVAISLQQLISLKYCSFISPYSTSFGSESLIGSIKKIFQRKEFITWTLLIVAWSFAFAIGYFYMQQFEDKSLHLEHYDFSVQTLFCKFPSYLKPKYKYCTINLLTSNSINIAFFIVLLVVPNFIIFLSYGYICYHIWSSSRKFLNDNHQKLATVEQQHQEHVFYISIQKSSYQKVNIVNDQEICEAIETASVGILNRTQIMTLTKIIQSKQSLKPVSIDINYQSRYNAFEVETIIKTEANKKHGKITNQNNLSTSNMIKKRNKTVTLTICLMAICFTFCWFPFFSFPLFYSKILDNNVFINLKVAIHLLGYSSSVWSPLIYILRCEKFKSSAKPLLESIKFSFDSLIKKIFAFLNCKFFRKRQFCIRKSKNSSFGFWKKSTLRRFRVQPVGM
jgi:hypothetical protein